jgi:hypothetical protein
MHIQTRLDPEILKAAKKAAKLEGTSLSEYLRKLVQRNVEIQEGKSKAGKRQSKNEGDSDRIR